jgi:hypothetical protein
VLHTQQPSNFCALLASQYDNTEICMAEAPICTYKISLYGKSTMCCTRSNPQPSALLAGPFSTTYICMAEAPICTYKLSLYGNLYAAHAANLNLQPCLLAHSAPLKFVWQKHHVLHTQQPSTFSPAHWPIQHHLNLYGRSAMCCTRSNPQAFSPACWSIRHCLFLEP